jgi:nucleotide-binding universal stress UspA family protein
MAIEIKRILVPTDFSTYADYAMRHAADLAKDFGAELLLLHVVPEGDLRAMYDYPPDFPLEQILADQKKIVEQRFAEIVTNEQKRGVQAKSLIYSGKAYEEIIQTAKAHTVDLIVIATHGRTGLSHVFLGSVAEKVVRLAPCPVLTIKPPAQAETQS